MKNLINVEEAIGVKFNNSTLIQTALTHSSYAKQFKDAQYNERLEFLGDSVLQLCITEYLFVNYKNKSEGELTKIRSLIVCENSLYKVARKINLSEFIRMSRGEELTGGRERISIQADAVEAVLAAIYLDRGIEEANKFIMEKFMDIISKAVQNKIILDFKTKLQELLQVNGEVNITYELIKYEGPPHHRKFFVSVFLADKEMGKGLGYSKKEAEQNAAKEALINLEAIDE
ncbi:ribonuclease III [Clostridium vincentii]|uniref:Ribonuclease 3 n=1 Tax=Clostridium vincentii TaxID=52704 RepID=A0A2T0BJW2_9CLOT|nr:ribonuclease III [Clostridium vincentii]PRR84164.1 Ribonuclease 3 [Clostridium vincentii]